MRRSTSMHRRFLRAAVFATSISLALGACGSDSNDAAQADATTTTALQGPSYSTTAFILPFDVTVPEMLPAEPTTDTANFVTWESATGDYPAVRFLVPVNVYVPGDTEPTPPPADYLTYLLGQSDDGATFSDQAETTVDGFPATLVTAAVTDNLDGSLGCPAENVAADECYGLQPERDPANGRHRHRRHHPPRLATSYRHRGNWRCADRVRGVRGHARQHLVPR